jgi:hypothetical protein
MLLAALSLLLALQARSLPIFRQHASAPVAAKVPLGAKVAPGQTALGVATTPLARNWWRPWRPADLQSVSRFERAVRAHAQIVMWYADWQHSEPSAVQLSAVADRGSVPEITWEPWDASRGLHKAQPRYRLTNIIDGKFDPYIRRWARRLAAWRHPVLVRFAQEMDGNWYPWDEQANHNRPGEYVRAWRHVHDIFTRAGATNVRWVWSPAFAVRPELFPGTRYVDMFGVTCLNSGRTRHGGTWRSFVRICSRPIADLHALSRRMPIQLSETGTSASGGSKAGWIAGMFDFLRSHPEVRVLVWFNVQVSPNWTITSSPAAERRLALGLRTTALSGVRTQAPAASAARSAATSRSQAPPAR